MIKDVMSVCIYVDDFSKAFDFYAHVLGLEKSQDAGENACFFRLNDNPMAIYLEGGHEKKTQDPKATGLAFMMVVEDAKGAYQSLKEEAVHFVHDAPQDMGEGNYWFRFYDPAGNILEIVSAA